jgi:glycosyltransferase involved in cell wall biosynthesis
MAKGPLVSVIIIFLDSEKYIADAIESVLAQTYDDWELWLVDDGSSDGSSQVARHYVEQNPGKVHYLDHPGHENRGMSASRNLAIASANGDYVAFLDSDDVWLPYKLERQVPLMISHPEVAMLYDTAQFWFSWMRDTGGTRSDHLQRLRVQPGGVINPPRLLPTFIRDESTTPCTSSILLRRDAIERVGGYEATFRGMYEDQAFYVKICTIAPVFVASGFLCRVRVHPDSLTSRCARAGQYASARTNFLEWVAAHLSERGVDDDEIWRALRIELLIYRHLRLDSALAEVYSVWSRILPERVKTLALAVLHRLPVPSLWREDPLQAKLPRSKEHGRRLRRE